MAVGNLAPTDRGFTGHEMLDPVGLVHMNGRVYDPEIGRFLSADPFVQDPSNLQSWNRYSYVINNPLSLTDPSGFFFSGLLKSLWGGLKSMFSMIGRTLQTVLKNPLVRSIIQIVGCAAMGPGAIAGCAGLTGALTLGAGGSLTAALKSAASAFASAAVFTGVGEMLGSNPNLFVKAAVHGVAGGALSVAQGGNFLQGFAANAVGAFAGGASDGAFGPGGASPDIIAHTLIVAAAGCASASLTGGKCADAAVTAAFANIYNAWGGLAELSSVPFYTSARTSDWDAYRYFSANYDAESWTAHNYSVLGDERFPTWEAARKDLSEYPGPYWPGYRAHYPGGVKSGQQSILPLFGRTSHYINPSSGTVFNIPEGNWWSWLTGDGHLLGPGVVMRSIVQDSSGSFRILNVGVGNGFPYALGAYPAPKVWQGQRWWSR